ncbi:hypothetical protein [Nocardioides sp. Soil805]|uniref:hypothetical protein n=1 Tax=Nocardioides sp. Soil805 TaxID=1736416 RepID=UPI000702B627|nr:hypothetical protein [Nocardioides sp. Soil805]KRF34947.1 hypothetical protein ASG94_12430 [Nocardioides sp. Soil805]
MDTTQGGEKSSGASWSDQIDRSFGEGPRLPEPARYLAAGRAAVRRRRLAAGVASLAAVAVLFGATWAVLPGDARAGAGLVANDPSPSTAAESPSPTAESPSAPELEPLVESDAEVRIARTDDEMVMLGRGPAVAPLDDGSLVRRPGWTVERLVVLEDLARHKSWGVDLSRDDGTAEQWALASWSSDGATSISFDRPGKRFAEFEDWIRATWADEQRFKDVEPGQDVPVDDSVAAFVDGDVVAADGVTLLEVVMSPKEAAAYGPVAKQAAVRLRLADGTEMFGRVDEWGTTTVDPAVLDAPTMAAFLRHLASQADSGEGLR